MNDPDTLISYPSLDDSQSVQASSSSSQPRQVLQDRIYVGNLHPTVDEYTVLQLFSKYGKITKLDFLFHKNGPLKGKPRGYCFVEYASHDEALKALSAHEKLLRGRKLVVTHAHQAPLDSGGAQHRPRKNMMESGRPTTLSLLKSGTTNKHHDRTSNKIAMMEAKLRQLEASKDIATSSASTLPSHPSLPPKPLPGDHNSSRAPHKPASGPPPTLASLASATPTGSKVTSGLRLVPSTSTLETKPKGIAPKTKSTGLLGVKIVKPKKEKEKPAAEGAHDGTS
ncbi:hypothetical protein VNI00_000068 [Paramarasmius palmivorus]|uniref:Probable RNA-binding protein 18 n=1 Tax=Paramarasmius palmivorus TaxID=297713 RepID=A0AAW0EEZ3_9AGAR